MYNLCYLSQGDEYVINTALKDDRETRLSVSGLTAQVRILVRKIFKNTGLASPVEVGASYYWKYWICH